MKNQPSPKNKKIYDKTIIEGIKISLIFFHLDYTIATGIAPVPALRLAEFTAGWESHPALKIYLHYYYIPKGIICIHIFKQS